MDEFFERIDNNEKLRFQQSDNKAFSKSNSDSNSDTGRYQRLLRIAKYAIC